MGHRTERRAIPLAAAALLALPLAGFARTYPTQSGAAGSQGQTTTQGTGTPASDQSTADQAAKDQKSPARFLDDARSVLDSVQIAPLSADAEAKVGRIRSNLAELDRSYRGLPPGTTTGAGANTGTAGSSTGGSASSGTARGSTAGATSGSTVGSGTSATGTPVTPATSGTPAWMTYYTSIMQTLDQMKVQSVFASRMPGTSTGTASAATGGAARAGTTSGTTGTTSGTTSGTSGATSAGTSGTSGTRTSGAAGIGASTSGTAPVTLDAITKTRLSEFRAYLEQFQAAALKQQTARD